jgi:hypothetical protein
MNQGQNMLLVDSHCCKVFSEDRVIAGNQATVLNHLFGGLKHLAECYGVGFSSAALESRKTLTAAATPENSCLVR